LVLHVIHKHAVPTPRKQNKYPLQRLTDISGYVNTHKTHCADHEAWH
jgi:hypothetical protein